jgi:hypothetical protein
MTPQECGQNRLTGLRLDGTLAVKTGGGISPERSMRRSAIMAGLWLALFLAPAFGQQKTAPAPSWPDSYLTRLEVLALIQTLNGALLASRSATLTLEKWCADHKLAAEPKILARLVRGVEKPASAETRQRLQVSAEEPVKHRHVELTCGDHVLSEADNWYVPSRLTPEMNQLLETTDTPFGKAVQALGFHRQTFSADILWSPLPQGWERGAAERPTEVKGILAIPERLFEHRAVLYDREQKPFSEVDEVYADDLLAFPPPAARP